MHRRAVERILCAVAIAVVATVMAPAAAQPLTDPDLTRLYSELRPLFRRFYPGVSASTADAEIRFESDTRVFSIHHPTKTGEWQDASPTRGPNRGGILCEILLAKGRFQGAAAVPQTFDEKYFKVLLLAPYSTRRDAHLIVRLSFPDGTSKEFLRRFTELVNAFAS